VVRVVIVGGLVADAVLVWVGMGVAADVPRRAEAHEAESENQDLRLNVHTEILG
jgi:hypothetical protein